MLLGDWRPCLTGIGQLSATTGAQVAANITSSAAGVLKDAVNLTSAVAHLGARVGFDDQAT
jgi:hypothetical protein